MWEMFLSILGGLALFDTARYVFQDRNSLAYALYPKTFGWLISEIIGDAIIAFIICLVVKIGYWLFA